MRTVTLKGRDATELGQVVAHMADELTAMALTRGLHPKPYAAVDPNEDAVALGASGSRRLAIVADGHHGAEAAEAAVTAVLDWCGDSPPPPDIARHDLVELLAAADAAAAAGTRSARTTLAIAWAEGERAQWVSFGDSAVLLADPHDGVQLSTDRHVFLGERWSMPELAARASTGRARLAPGTSLILVTDGFTGYAAPVGAPGRAAAAVAAEATGAEALARGLVEHACSGGAGDNVAAAVLSAPEAES